MPIFKRLHLSAIAAALLTLTVTTPASAQGLFSLFDFGSSWDQNWNGGSETRRAPVRIVAFPANAAPGQIIASFTDKTLYYVAKRGRAIAYPIATPRRRDAWQGRLQVTSKKINPSWTPTAEMRRENPRLPAFVPGGHPHNPMGSRALYLGSTLYRIHGTDAPWTIGQPVSKGCIRMHNAHVEDLYARVGVGTTVTVTYQSFTKTAAYW